MRFGGRLAVCAALWASAAGAQPVIVDPPVTDPPTLPYELSIEAVVPGGLDQPGALVFFGDLEDEEFLILEKNTGRVRHFVDRVEQPVALDLPVDNCGERGLVGIALHPNFGAAVPVTDPPTEPPPDRDWVYVSYFTDEGRSDDGCDADAVLRVGRFMWTGTALVPDPPVLPAPFTPFALADLPVTASTAVSGAIATRSEVAFDIGQLVARLYLVIGSGDRLPADDLPLQNKAPDIDPVTMEPFDPVFDDTSVVLRLDESGGTPTDNPVAVVLPEDPDDPLPPLLPENRYFVYGFRDAKGLTTDPFTGVLWFTEESDEGKPDEINLTLSGTNGGYRDYQGKVNDPEEPLDKDNMPNPDYPLFDLLKIGGDDPRFKDLPVGTYLNPSFSFEDNQVGPSGLAFGGFEVGPQHRFDLFVGARDGRLFRFPMNSGRSGFALTGDLLDGVADVANPGDPTADPPIPATPADELEQILIGTGFGEISHVETGPDGSIYVVDRASGAVHRVFYSAIHDLSVVSAKVSKKISLSAKKPRVTKAIKLTLANVGARGERILGSGGVSEAAVADLSSKLTGLLGITIAPPLGAPTPVGCQAPVWSVPVPSYAKPPYPAAIGIAQGGSLKLEVDVTWECDGAFTPGTTPYDIVISLDGSAIGIDESDQTPENAANDLCARPPTPPADPDDEGDPGCGAKGGGPLRTELILK